MKNVLITGTNGMIGRLVLEECLKREDVAAVTSVTRKPLGLQHPKLKEVLHQDFLDYSSIGEQFRNQDVCFYCIGVYTGKVPTAEFKKITVDFTKAFADALGANSKELTFCFLSGEGADSSEKSRILFAREKGIAENYLLKAGFRQVYLFRPGYIYPVTPRQEPNLLYKFMRVIYPFASKLYPNMGVSSEKLAAKMVDVGLNGGKKTIYENRDIRE
jgi:nucleoside-diphosphate-sugar epimerase